MVSRNIGLAAIVLVVSAVITALGSAYMISHQVPAVLRVRPELAEVGFWTGVFSGRAMEYLFYHYPEAMVVVEFVLVAVALVLPAFMGGE